MLSSLSWNFFLTTVAVLAAAYYVITTLLLFQKEITGWIRSRSTNSAVSQAETKSSVQNKKRASVIGDINLRDGLADARSSSITAEDLAISDHDEELEVQVEQTLPVPIKDDLLIGTVADLLEEIKTVAQLIADSGAEKSEAESLFRTLLLRYPNIRATSYRDAVTLYICKSVTDRCAFDLPPGEVTPWWEEEAVSNSNIHP